jgi:nucleoside-diphosphate-sugar epimerase
VICLDRVFFGRDIIADFVKNPNFTLAKDDVRTFDKSILTGVDVVMDLAAISNDPACDLDPGMTEDINWRGSVRLATLAKEMGVPRYIYSSSCSVYGQGATTSLTEDSPLTPVSLYAECKIRTERDILALSSDGFCATILRNATVYGPSRRMRYDLLVNLMTAKAFTDRIIYVLGGGQQWRPNVHLRDVARAFCHVMCQPAQKVCGRVFNVGSNDQNFRVIDIAHIVRDVMPYVSIEVVPDDPDKRTYNVSFDRITDELGFHTIYSIPDAVAEIKHRMTKGTIWPFGDLRTKTLDYYAWLIKARNVLDDVSLDGKLF